MKVVVLLNHAAGTGNKAEQKTSPEKVEELLRSHAIQATAHWLSAESLDGIVREAVAARVDAVVAGGGDGTISSVAGRLAGTSIPLGILPLGTLNHFAKDLQIPLDLEEAIWCVLQGRPRPVDVGEVNGHVFINNSSIGAYPHMVEKREEQQERLGRGKWPAMFLATCHVSRRWPLFHVKLTLDGETAYRTTPFVFVGNNEYAMDLFSIGARPRFDQGRLSVYTASCPSAWSMVRLLGHALLNRLDQARDFEARLVRTVEINPHKRKVRVSRDGEVMHLETPLRYRTRPGDLLVITPPPKKTE